MKMKLYGALCIAVAIVMLLAPLAAIPLGKPTDAHTTEAEEETQADTTVPTVAEPEDEDTISVFMTDNSKAETLKMRDYIIGTVSAEVPASYDTEAIKAQALAAVTFAEYRKSLGGDANIGGADISDDSSMHQGYITKEEMEEKWGEAFDAYYEKIAEAVDEVLGEVITYDEKPIMAAYHAISSGQTESAEVMWGDDIPYLQSVDSEWDEDSTRFSSEVIFSSQELAEIVGGDSSEYSQVKIKSTSDVGTVLEIEIFGVSMTGMEARKLLGLRSPVFDVSYEDGEYVFSVKGYGHGVGMSQNGANCMAQDGCTYKEIISHYYKGTEITKR